MSTNASQPFLPSEIILYIIDCLIPPPNLLPIAFPPSHPITHTLLSLARTSKVTYTAAIRLLYTHCLYLGSPQRIKCLSKSLNAISARVENPCADLPRMFVPHITSLYLCPFNGCTKMDPDLSVALDMAEILSVSAPTLSRLLIDVPLRFLYGSAANRIPEIVKPRTALRGAFERLTALETFCSVRDELYLGMHVPVVKYFEQRVWSLWPKLRMLALYNQDVSVPQFWEKLGKLENLETLVLTRSDGLEEVNIKEEWKKCCGDKNRGLNIVLVNVESGHRAPMGLEGWKDDDKVVVRQLNVPISYYGDETEVDLCQWWVKRRVMRGEDAVDWT
jgi:hypothetical protein